MDAGTALVGTLDSFAGGSGVVVHQCLQVHFFFLCGDFVLRLDLPKYFIWAGVRTRSPFARRKTPVLWAFPPPWSIPHTILPLTFLHWDLLGILDWV
jgi:hypothetical protein